MFTKELVDFLNQSGNKCHADWLEANPAIRNFVTCPCVIIRPNLFHDAQRIAVTDNQFGRFVTILRRDGERRYILQVNNESITIDTIESLIRSIGSIGGTCHVERTFFVIDLPFGYLLEMANEELANIILSQDKFEDIGIR